MEITGRLAVVFSFGVRTAASWERRKLREKETREEIMMGSEERKECEG